MLFYMATPYSKWPAGIEDAFHFACEQAACLMRLGIPVFSPIAHSHPIAVHGRLDPLDHAIWLPADQPLMDAATGLIVIMAFGWRESHGVQHEIAVFRSAGKPVVYLDVIRSTNQHASPDELCQHPDGQTEGKPRHSSGDRREAGQQEEHEGQQQKDGGDAHVC